MCGGSWSPGQTVLEEKTPVVGPRRESWRLIDKKLRHLHYGDALVSIEAINVLLYYCPRQTRQEGWGLKNGVGKMVAFTNDIFRGIFFK